MRTYKEIVKNYILIYIKLYHYQDYKNREIDAVVELEDGRWCAFEIKLGANQIDAAAKI